MSYKLTHCNWIKKISRKQNEAKQIIKTSSIIDFPEMNETTYEGEKRIIL